MELEEYMNVVRGRYNELTDEEKTIAEDAADSPVGDVINKLFGPEMSSIVFDDQPMEQPTEQPMADQMQTPPPMNDQMESAGLGT